MLWTILAIFGAIFIMQILVNDIIPFVADGVFLCLKIICGIATIVFVAKMLDRE